MQSVESASSQASSDWPSSGEDDLEVFLSEEGRSGVGGGHSRSSLSSSSSSSGLGWSGTESEGEKEKEKTAGTQGDLLFAQKCLELQGFVRPMLELLNGLKKGRFDKGLSSFQQSVAMDRIQRIVGVLQKPHIGEKYLPTLLQVEMMLKHWFPQVSLQPAGQKPCSSSSITPPHKRKDQLHIPVKKRRLSWSDTDSSQTSPPVACKRSDLKEKDERVWDSPFNPAPADRRGEELSGSAALRWSEPSLTWVHVAPIPSPPTSCPSQKTTGSSADHFLLAHPPPASRGSLATQDSAVSSTTPCSEPVAPQGRSETPTQTEGRDPGPAVTTRVFSSLQT